MANLSAELVRAIVAAVAGAIVGALLGAGQAFLLWGSVAAPHRWITATMLGLAVATALAYLLVRPLEPRGALFGGPLPLLAGCGAVCGVAYGAITGRILRRFRDDPIAPT